MDRKNHPPRNAQMMLNRLRNAWLALLGHDPAADLREAGRGFFNEACAILDGDAARYADHPDAEAYSYFRHARERFRAALK